MSICLLAVVLAVLSATSHGQDYRSSVVGTEFDFIDKTDPSTFLCLEFKGLGPREMPDKTRPSPLIQSAYIFVAYFDDGTSIDMAIDADFETEEAARDEALRYTLRLGKLPTSLRSGVDRMVVHQGELGATAFSDIGLIVVYSDNATKRISTHDLEETLFHESVHAAWDRPHRGSPGWRAAQTNDGAFVTDYARENPNGEDLAESALFAYTLLHHPERIPAADAARIMSTIPARVAFVETLLPPGKPVFYSVGPKYACDGSGTTFQVDAIEEPVASSQVPNLGSGASSECRVDLSRVGTLSDIISNALNRGLDQDGDAVYAFLSEAKRRCKDSNELLDATAAEFGFDRATLEQQVEEYYHCNCEHGELVDSAPASSSAPQPAAGSGDRDNVGTAELRQILYLISALLLLLLVANAATLMVLIKRS